MRRLILAAAAASTMLLTVATVNSGALAAPIAPSTALPDASRSLDQVQDIRYVHHRHYGWHHRHYGWHHRHWGWRHRHWHHRHWY
jgi:hypothetical protein